MARCRPRTMPGARRIAATSSPSPTGWCGFSPIPRGAVQRLRNLGLLAFDLLPPAKAALSSLSTGAGRPDPEARARRSAHAAPGAAARTALRPVQAVNEPRLRRRDRRGGRHRHRHGESAAGAQARRSRPGGHRCRAPRAAPRAGTRDWDLRVFALSRASQRLLQLCGAFGNACRRSGCSLTSACASGMRAACRRAQGSLDLRLRRDRRTESRLHRRGPRIAASAALQAAAAAGAVVIEAAVQEVAVSDADARIRLNDGRELSAAGC